jgi:hypothetical protein
MMEQKVLGTVVPFPGPRFAKRRRVSAPPLKRIRLSAELRVFLERMAERGRA